MKLIGLQKLAALKGESAVIDKWISSWVSEIVHSAWKEANDVSDHFPAMKVEGNAVFLFSVEKTGICIRLKVAFAQGIAIITDLSRNS